MSDPKIFQCDISPGMSLDYIFHPSMVEMSDAFLLNTAYYIPVNLRAPITDPNRNAFLVEVQHARSLGKPTFITTGDLGQRDLVDPQIELGERAGLISLPITSEKTISVMRGLQAVMRREGTLDDKIEHARTIFDGKSFHDRLPFLETVLTSALKDYADSLPYDEGPIVIDCGHIDSKDYTPTHEDLHSLIEGLILTKYLQHLGHEDVRIGILVNEMYLFGTEKKREARKTIRRLRSQVKNEGRHNLIDKAYWGIFQAYGFDAEKFSRILTCSFEGSLNLRARQDIEAYENDGDHPFQTELEPHGERGYSVRMTLDDGRPLERVLTSDSGAPVCSLMSAEHNRRYDDADAGRLVYLRDAQWRSAIRCGARSARALYGTDLPITAFFYGTVPDGRIGIESHEKL